MENNINKLFGDVFTDEDKRDWFQFVVINLIFTFVAIFMTIINILLEGPSFATAGFAIVCIVNAIMAFYDKRGYKIAKVLFAVELFFLFV